MSEQNTTATDQHLEPTPPNAWYRSPVKLMFAIYLATSFGFLVPMLKAITPIDDSYQSIAGDTVGGDFSVFYIAGKMASQGSYSALYQADTFAARREKIFSPLDGAMLYFNYPPTALLLFTPFSKLPYMLAYGLWIVLLLTCAACTIYAFTKNRIITAAALLSPAFLWCIVTGQLGFLVTALMGSGLYMLNKGNKMTAGMLFGLLIIKPHLALALPICMIATKQWRVIFGGILSASLAVLISLFIFGPEAWIALATQLTSNVTGHLNANGNIADRIPTIFVTLVHLTHNTTLATTLHTIGAVVAIMITAYVWRTSSDTTARLITLIITPALISPYYFDYDLTGIGLIFAVMMVEASKIEPRKFELVALTWLWLVSFFMLLGKINIGFTGPVFLLGLLAYALYRATEIQFNSKAATPREITA